MKSKIYLLFFILILFSCSQFKEVHYFKDSLEPVSNYYQVNISGYSLFSSSRFVSGYYDRYAIQEYFGEITQPNNGKLTTPNPIGTSNPNQELVLLLSTNSDAIASGIGNLVKNKTTINSVSLLANKDKVNAANEISVKKSILDNNIEIYKMKVEASLPQNDSLTQENLINVKKEYLNFVRNELKELYPNEDIPDNMRDIKKWLNTKK